MTSGGPLPRWNFAFGVDVLSPKTDAFLAEIGATCRDHGLILAHDVGPGLTVAPFNEALLGRVENARLATSGALKVRAEIVGICRRNGLVLTHEADIPCDGVWREPSGRFVLAAWSEERASDLRHAMIWDEVECFVYAGKAATGGPQ